MEFWTYDENKFGERVSESNDGGQNVTVWKSETPQTVAGFSFGRFKVEEAKLTKPQMFIQSYANEETPNWVRSIQQIAEGDNLADGLNSIHSRGGRSCSSSFWNDQRELLLERNPQGYRAIDAGPLTMGYRASNSRTGFDVTRRLIYPKGAYILHMIRMMMFDRQTGDKNFKEAMQDFVNTYRGKAATTEDFKAIIEKHMTPDMDAEGNHKMDWFFNEYVYGTQLPSYKLDYSFDTGTDGTIVLNFNLGQSGVDDKFRMVVPVYLELDDGKVAFQGRMRLVGNNASPAKVPLKGLKAKPRRALINYSDDVLASPN